MPVPDVVVAAEYLGRNPLSPMLRGNRLQLPRAAVGSNIRPEIHSALERGLKASITEERTPVAGIRLCPDDARIILTAGFLCERWCSSYRIAKIFHGNAQGLEDFELAWPRPNVPFLWPADVPEPSVEGDCLADSANILFPVVISATVLHEVSHEVLRDCSLTPSAVELACDAYATDYLLGNADPAGREIIALAVAVWMCSLCSEALLYTEHDSARYPSPVVRMEQFVSRHLAPHRGNDKISKIELLCVGHIVNLARIRRPEECAVVCERAGEGDPLAFLHDLRACWEAG